MPTTLEERVAYLEGKVEEHTKAWVDLKGMMVHLEGRIDALDQKLDRRIDAVDQKLSGRIDALDQKFSKYFLWLFGVQVTILLAVIAALLSK